MIAAFKNLLRQLHPRGNAMPPLGSDYDKLLGALAIEFARINGRIDDLVREVTLQGTVELLDLWEIALGLPDPCAIAPLTDDERLASIKSKLAATGGQSVAYLTAIAARYGITMTVVESEPFEVGFHRMGDPIGGDEWRFIWYANSSTAPADEIKALYQCVIQALMPGHTFVVFVYEGVEFAGLLDELGNYILSETGEILLAE